MRLSANWCFRFREAVAALLDLRPRPRRKPIDAAARLGREGEQRAARFLRKAGYKILCRNFRPLYGGEVDLVCRIRGTTELVFVEVKTRSSESYGSPADAVDWEKQRRIVQAAAEWCALLEQQEGRKKNPRHTDTPEVTVRFDVIELLQTGGAWELRHWEDAFTGEETRHPGSMPLSPGATRGDVLPKRGRGGGAPFRRRRGRG